MSGFGWRTTAAEVVAGVDLSGRRAVITGASSGIGLETARALGLAGASLVLSEPGDPSAARRRFAEAVLGHHRRWRVFRASLRALYATDAEVHEARLAQRARQIAQTERLLAAKADRAAILTSMLLFEALCDSIADGDIAALGVEEAPLIDRLVEELDKLV